MEKWKDIKGYEGRYKISSRGRVISYFQKTKLMATSVSSKGDIVVGLSSCGVQVKRCVRVLVGEAFIGGYKRYFLKDGNRYNVCLENIYGYSRDKDIKVMKFNKDKNLVIL